MEKDLHAQKVEILSRLIKESSLTLDEALLLLKEEEQPVYVGSPIYSPPIQPSNPYIGGTSPFTVISGGLHSTTTGDLSGSYVVTNTNGSFSTTGNLTPITD